MLRILAKTAKWTGILILLLVGGIFAYRSIQVSLFPEKTFPKIKVIAQAGDQPVDLMMLAITQPLENAVNQVQGVQMVRSTTSRGSTELSVYLDWSVDMDVSMQRVNSRINQIQNTLLPNTAISVEKMSPSILPVMDFALTSDSRDLIELRNLLQCADLIVKSALHRKESRGLHYTLDYPELLPQAVDTVLVP